MTCITIKYVMCSSLYKMTQTFDKCQNIGGLILIFSIFNFFSIFKFLPAHFSCIASNSNIHTLIYKSYSPAVVFFMSVYYSFHTTSNSEIYFRFLLLSLCIIFPCRKSTPIHPSNTGV